jgi:hypothetical protein
VWDLPSPVWKDFQPHEKDLEILSREANLDTSFDSLKLRRNMWDGHKAGTIHMVARECDCARVIALIHPGQHPPWELWGRLFQWLGAPKAGGQWRILSFSADHPRRFPPMGEPLGAEHLNGGYTMPCSHESVVVYRYEEGTRVLIHELLHASCLDPAGERIEVKEATIETWAELFLVALLSRGSPRRAAELWKKQAQWIRDVNDRASRHHGVTDETAYGWRYTVGREHVFRRLGISLPTRASRRLPESSRFTNID